MAAMIRAAWSSVDNFTNLNPFSPAEPCLLRYSPPSRQGSAFFERTNKTGVPMDSSQLLGITTFAYLLSAIIYIGLFIFRSARFGFVATTVTTLAFLINTAGIGLRWVESHQMGIGYAPLSNMYESLVFFAWSIAVVYLWLEYKYKNRFLGAFAMPFAAIAMGLAEMKNPAISPLVPALQSNWLIAHVVTCFIGYAAFAVACGFGVIYLLKQRAKEKKMKGLTEAAPGLEDH